MLKLITGIPGAGKTLYAVSMLKKAVEHNASLPVDEQRAIYCDITGLTIDGIEPPPLDWRKTPPKSLLIYDEAQLQKPFKAARGLSPYEYIENLTLSRKQGHEIWYITQAPKRLHANILDMVEEHHHLDRPYGAKLANVYLFRTAEVNPRSRTAIEGAERKSLFNYDKRLFDLYKSSEVDDDGIKLRLPPKLFMGIAVILAIFGFSAYMFFGTGTQNMLTGEGKNELVADVEPLSAVVSVPPHAPVEQLPELQSAEHIKYEPTKVIFEKVAMVVSNNNLCIAKDASGQTLDISSDECLLFVSNPHSTSYIPVAALEYVYVDKDLPNAKQSSL
jgi:hypothetical protein